jgi:hypothetical protein
MLFVPFCNVVYETVAAEVAVVGTSTVTATGSDGWNTRADVLL